MRPQQLLLVAAAFAGQLMPVSTQSIDPNSVPLALRTSWCTAQQSSCPLLCTQIPGQSATTKSNTCDPTTLAYTCICGGGQVPNASEYSLTIPYYICTTANTNCANACANNNAACQNACVVNNPCGAQKPVLVNTTSSTTMSSTSTSSSNSGASTSADGGIVGFGGNPTTTSAGATSTGTPSSASLALHFGHAYGLGLVAAGLFAGFAFVL